MNAVLAPRAPMPSVFDLADGASWLRTRLEAGMGLVCNNVLHERSAFEDSAAGPRLLLRARFTERIAGTEGAWKRFAD